MATSSSASGSSQHSLDAIIGEITSSRDLGALNNTLRNYATKESRELIFASLLTGGQDPLSVLNVHSNTLGFLYLLSARLTVQAAGPPPLTIVQKFCAEFDPIQARYAPERVTLLAKGIIGLFESASSPHLHAHAPRPELSLPLLSDLLTRYPPSLAHLTTLHALFLRTCVTTRHFAAALPVLAVPVTEIEPTLSDLHYNDNLVYHYAGGVALAAMKRWAEAEEFFEIVVGHPAQAPAAIQLEALKKLALVQLILYGKLRDIPKYASPRLAQLVKNSPYGALVNAYPLQTTELERLVDRDAAAFESDRNLGLVRQVVGRARRWAIKKLTETYITLSLAEIGQQINLADEESVRSLIVNMIEQGEIVGSISADGTVTFDDTAPAFTKQQVETMLAAAQHQGLVLEELDRRTARSRDFLLKALKTKDDVLGGGSMDEEMFRMERGEGYEESLFS